MQYLLELKDRFPDCTFVTRIVHGQGPSDETAYDLIAYRADYDDPPVRDPGGPILTNISALRVNDRCSYFYRGLDCNLVRSDRCAETLRGLRAAETRSFPNLPYNNVPQYGALVPVIELGIYPLTAGSPSADEAPRKHLR